MEMKAHTDQLLAGVAKVEITNRKAGPVNAPLLVRALTLRQGATAAILVAVDAVAIGEIGSIGNEYLPNVRSQLNKELGINPKDVLVNASHCHGAVCADVEARTIDAVRAAWDNMVPVDVGVGVGHEDRIQENRRFKLRDGREADSRRAYSLPPDEEIEDVGPVDPEIGILRLDRRDGETLAVVYNFACHPIEGVPSGANTADIAGFASKVIEENMSKGTVALFLQGCAGDVNPAFYKHVDHLHDAEPLGNMLGLSALRELRKIRCREGATLKVINESIELPRADLAPYIESLRSQQMHWLQSLRGTSINLKSFLTLIAKHRLSPDYPSYYSHRYLHERMLGKDYLSALDAENRKAIEQYVTNIHIMERLTRIQVNLNLLKMHHAQNLDAGKDTVDVEVVGMRIGDFVLVTFPGELSVQIGLNIKQTSPHKFTFVSGCTNGYIYYAPTAKQLQNRGWAQEDSDCLLAPEWQSLFEKKVGELLQAL